MVTESPKPRSLPRNLNKASYIGFVLVGIYFAIIGKFGEAAMFGGLGLVFDPFDTTIPFNKRPLYQRAILLAHLVVTFVFLGLALVR